MRVLVIDDEKRVLTALKRFLKFQHEVTLVESGSEALLALALHPFDAILCDVHMTGMSGPTFASKLSPMDVGKLVFITAGAETADEIAQLEGYRVLLKPFSADEVFRAIDDVAAE